ncbi:MAG TPA: hypothetical protein VFZ16_09505 [Hyphomicrobiaceae bacterium]|nr:hypothetical protein [Hyphomicrobiaceae bacterium]
MSDNARASNGAVVMPALGPELWGPALAGAVKWNGKMYEGLALMGSEWLDFVNRRLKEDLKLPQLVCACSSPEEMRDIYAGFWNQAVDDYQREMVVMARLSSGFVTNSLAAARTRIEEATREMRHPMQVAA